MSSALPSPRQSSTSAAARPLASRSSRVTSMVNTTLSSSSSSSLELASASSSPGNGLKSFAYSSNCASSSLHSRLWSERKHPFLAMRRSSSSSTASALQRIPSSYGFVHAAPGHFSSVLSVHTYPWAYAVSSVSRITRAPVALISSRARFSAVRSAMTYRFW